MKVKSLLLALLSTSLLFGQEQSKLEDSFWNEKMQEIAKPESKEGVVKLKRNLFSNHESFFINNKKAFRLSEKDQMEYISTMDYKKGIKVHRYQQLFNNIQVEGNQMVIFEKEGEIRYVLGKLANGLEFEPESNSISKESVQSIALKYLKEKEIFETNYKTISPNLNLKFIKKNNISYELVYELTASSSQIGQPDILLYIDASDGKVVKEKVMTYQCNCCTGSTNTLYNGPQNITTHEYGGLFNDFELLDNCRGNGIETRFFKIIPPFPGFYDKVRDPNNTYVNNDKDKAAGSAHWAAQQTYDYFLNNHGLNSYNDQGAKINIRTNIGSDGAFTKSISGEIFFEFGKGGFGQANDDIVSLDVVGHEFAHGIMINSSQLPNNNEGGALGESFADIFGTMVEFFGQNETGDYLLGEDFHIQDGFRRSMADPDAKNETTSVSGCPNGIYNYDQADTYLGNNWLDFNSFPNCDQGGVHLNGGPQNYWFFLLAEGGTGTNDNNVAYNVQSIGRTDAADIAFLDMISLTPNSIYPDSREMSIAAAELLFGDCSNQVVQVIEAWNAVGVTSNAALNSPDPNFTAPASACVGTSFTLNPTVTTGVSHRWWFYPTGGSQGSPNTTTAPTFIANTSGNYQIEHEMTTSCGVFTMTQNIVVNSVPNVSVSNKYFCETNTAGDLNYNPTGGTMFGTGVVLQNGAWKFNASVAGVGTHQITYYYSSGGCSGVDYATITVDQNVTAQIVNFEQFYCESDNNVPLVGNVTNGTWFGNGVSGINGNYVFDPTNNAGANVIQYSVLSSNYQCSATDQITFYVDDPITFAPSIPFPNACAGANECFSANPNNSYSHNPTYSWNFANGTTSNNPIQCTQFTAGNYAIQLSGTNECGVTNVPLSLSVVAPFAGFSITTPDPICGNITLQTNYAGSSPISWSGNGVNANTGVLSNPSSDVVSRTITATIENACQVNTTKTFNNHYKKKDITPDLFCYYDGITQLEADIAPGSWSSLPFTTALNTSTGEFDPSLASTGTYSITHQSVCNKTNDIVILPGGPSGTEVWPKQIDDLGAGNESGRGIARASDGSYYLVGLFSGSIKVEPSEPTLVSNGGTDIYVAKYNECGIVWSKSFGSTANDLNPQIAIDHGVQEEFLYLSGTIAGNTTIPGACLTCSLTPTTAEKGFVAKMDADGVGIWATIPANNAGERNNIKGIDAFGGKIVTTGNFEGVITLTSNNLHYPALGGPNDRDIHAIGIEDNGSSYGSMLLNGIGSSNIDDGKAIAIDIGSQEIFITGYATSADMDANFITSFSNGKDVFVGSLKQNFTWNWSMLLGGDADDEGNGIDVDNNLIITGIMVGDIEMAGGIPDQTNNNSQDAFILGLQPSGQYMWHQLIGSEYDLDRGADVSILNQQVTMIGEFSGIASLGNGGSNAINNLMSSTSGTDRDIFLMTFNTYSGGMSFVKPIRGPSSDDFGHAISSVQDVQHYFATGDFTSELEIGISPNAGIDMYALRYDPQQASVFFKKKGNQKDENLSSLSKIKAYPNPFKDIITVETIHEVESSIEIIDITGKLIYSEGNIKAGESKIEFDFSAFTPGVYIIKSATPKDIEVLKVIKR